MNTEREQGFLPGFGEISEKGEIKTPEYFKRSRRVIEEEYPEIVELAETMFDRVHTLESYTKLARGLVGIQMMEQGWKLRALATVGMDAALEKGVSLWPTLLDLSTPSQVTEVNEDKLRQIPKSDRPLAFLHGHYRGLTPGALSTVVVAGENVDLLIGIESEERTRQYKTDQIIYTGKKRKDIFLKADLCNFIFEIRGVPYSDEGYRELLNIIKPGIYYGNSSYSDAVREERKERARLVGAKYIELETGPGLSTTELLAQGELRDYESEFLSLPFVHMPRGE